LLACCHAAYDATMPHHICFSAAQHTTGFASALQRATMRGNMVFSIVPVNPFARICHTVAPS
jgi:hypothetical protein